MSYKQRESTTGFATNFFSVGRSWNSSWFSYVSVDSQASKIVHFPDGERRTFKGTNDYLTNTRLTGNTNSGFTLSRPDGSEDVYGFVVTNSSSNFLYAFLTERKNAQGQKTTLTYFGYDPAKPVVRLQSVTDGDNHTTAITYKSTNNYLSNLIVQVTDPFGRSASLAYDGVGNLTQITDVASISSSFIYNQNYRMSSFTTPYGTTSFDYGNAFTNNGGASTNSAPNGRSILVVEPDGSRQLFLYTNSAAGQTNAYASGDVPSTTPFGNTFDNSNLDVRNTYHWGRLQYLALSTTNISSFNAADFRKARMRHWLQGTNREGATIGTLSLERDPSPDSAGTLEGQKTWYDYAGKTTNEFQGTQAMPLFSARIMPDGTSAFTRTDRNSLGNVATNVSTYSSNEVALLRTNTLTYAANDVDVIYATNAARVRVSSNAYNSYHQITSTHNALNEATVFTYNDRQQIMLIERASGLVTTNVYFTSGLYSNWLDTTLEYEIINAAPAYFRANAFTYTNGLPFTHSNECGLVVTNTWDALQRLRRIDYPDIALGGVNSTFVTNSYDNPNRPLDLWFTKDRLGNRTGFAYDALRRRTAVTNALLRVTAYEYCSCGSLTSVTDPLGNATTYGYDNQGRMIESTNPIGTGSDFYKVANKYDLLGRLTNISDSAGVNVTNYWNVQGLLMMSINAFGKVVTNTYDVHDRIINAVDANGVTNAFAYDDLDRLTRRKAPDGEETFGYTARGMTAHTNQIGNIMRAAYDALGRRTNEQFGALSGESFVSVRENRYTYHPSGQWLTLTDANENTTSWEYDTECRVARKLDANSSVMFTNGYNANGWLTARWTPAKGLTLLGYDDVGNLTSVNYQNSTDLSYAYDELNRLTTMVDAAGTTQYVYTNLDLLSEDGPWTADTVRYKATNGLRMSLSVTNPAGGTWTQNYGYDAMLRLKATTNPAGIFGYQYTNAIGPGYAGTLVRWLSLPGGSAITNSYNTNGLLLATGLVQPGGQLTNAHSYAYNSARQRTSMTNHFANAWDYVYDNLGQIYSARGHEPDVSTNRSHEQLGYLYDPAGNLNVRTNNALLQTFNVNNLNQLGNITRDGTLTVAGSFLGQPTNVTVNDIGAAWYVDGAFAATNFTPMDGLNSYTSAVWNATASNHSSITAWLPTNQVFEYDGNGNLISDGRRGYDYDDADQLIRVTETNSWKTEYTYDGKFRLRVRTEYAWSGTNFVVASETRYIYDGMLVIQERDGNNTPTITYTRGRDLSGTFEGAGGIGGLLAMTDHSQTAASVATAYYHADANGNVTALLNTNGYVVARYAYDPFGNTLSLTGPKSDANRYRFSSKEAQTRSGLYSYGRRFYAPEWQRWVNRDPIQELEGINLYGFVRNDPLDRYDSFGEADAPKDQPPITSPPVFGEKPFIPDSDNCFCYALDIPGGQLHPDKSKYGTGVGKNCKDLVAQIKTNWGGMDVPKGGKCPAGSHKISVFSDKNGGYHTQRLDSDGGWSEMSLSPTYPPRKCRRGDPGRDCGDLCMPNQPKSPMQSPSR